MPIGFPASITPRSPPKPCWSASSPRKACAAKISGARTFVAHAWEWSRTYGGHIDEQFRRLGFGADWQRSRFTMDEGSRRRSRRVFVQLYREGLIYRGTRLINWDPTAKTTVSDAELEYVERDGIALAHPLSVRARRPERRNRSCDHASGDDARRRRDRRAPQRRALRDTYRAHRAAPAAARTRDSDRRRRSGRSRVRHRGRQGDAGARSRPTTRSACVTSSKCRPSSDSTRASRGAEIAVGPYAGLDRYEARERDRGRFAGARAAGRSRSRIVTRSRRVRAAATSSSRCSRCSGSYKHGTAR